MASRVNHDFFSSWSEAMAYVLGFWFADGWMTQPYRDASVCFVSKDRTHLEMIRGLMQSEHTIHSQGIGCFRLPIGSKKLWRDLTELGGCPAKSLVIAMPTIPSDYIRHFIRGYVDGDGTLYWEVSGRPAPGLGAVGGIGFLESLSRFLDEYVGVGKATVRTYANKAQFITYTGIKAKAIAMWLYSDTIIVLERKAILAVEFEAWQIYKFGWKSVASITPRMQQILTK